MKIVYLTPQLPYPPFSGGRKKTLSTLKALYALGIEVIVFTFIEDYKEKKFINELYKIGIKKIFIFYNREIAEKSRKKQLIRIVKSVFSKKPYGVLRYYSKDFDDAVRNYVNENINDIDYFWTNFIYMVQYVTEGFKGKMVMESQDVESRLFQQAFLKGSILHLKLLYLLEWIKYFNYEKKIYKKFNIIFTVSDADKSLLNRITGKKNIFTLPPVIRTHIGEFKFKKNTLLFVGDLYWYPNKDSLTWFLKKIYPKLKVKIPGLELWIVGRLSPNYKLIKLDGVKYLGFQPYSKLIKYLSKAQIFVAPMIYGTGIKMKILEAMSWGLPVVTTLKGITGINVKHNKEVMVAKNDEEFIDLTLELKNNDKLRQKLIKNAYEFIEKNYTRQNLVGIIRKNLFAG